MTDNWTTNRRRHQAKNPRKIDMTPIIDAGRDYYKRDPEALLISVARKAAAQYASKTDQLAFTEGYSQARAQHDAFKNEQAQATAPTEDPTADPA